MSCIMPRLQAIDLLSPASGGLAGYLRKPLGLATVLLMLAGCAGQPVQAPETQQPAEVVLPFENKLQPASELDEDIVFHYLLADLAAQRGQLKLALSHYQLAALLASDATAARRATQIALFLKDWPAAAEAAGRWVEISPNSSEARTVSGILLLRTSAEVEALEQFAAAIAIADARGKDGYLTIAMTLSKESTLENRQQVMQKIVSSAPDNAKAWYASAFLLSADKAFDEGYAAIERALELDPDFVNAKLLKVRMLIEQQRIADAVTYLGEVLEQHPQSNDLRMIYARLLVSQDNALAYDEFEKIARDEPDNMEVVSILAVLAVQLERYGDARDWLHLQIADGNAEQRGEAAYRLGQIEELEGNLQLASEFYLQVEAGDHLSDARLAYARVQAELGNLDNARAILKSMRLSHPDQSVEFYLVEADIIADVLPVEAVFELYDTALRASPDNMDLLYARGVFAANQAMVDKAEADLRRVIEDDPGHADALNALGYTLTDLTDRHQEALKLIGRAYRLKPDSAAIIDSMGWVNYRLGNLPQAREYLQRALDLQNDDEIAAHLGEVLWMLGEQDAAEQIWERAISDFPDSEKLKETIERVRQVQP